MSYQQVAQALAQGADPATLCMTCPWDRMCIQPPEMTQSDLDARVKEASDADEAHAQSAVLAAKKAGLPIRTLLTALTLAPLVSKATVCPVLALRLRLPEGQQIAGTLKQHMQTSID